MKFEVSCSNTEISDAELSDLLYSVYVDGGYTTPEKAKTLFQGSAVKSRGTLFIAKEVLDKKLAGMVVVVPGYSDAKVLAKDDECEIHLLGVKSEFRGNKLGKILVEVCFDFAKRNNWKKIVLYTQYSMTSAHALYESCGFRKNGVLKKDDTEFIVYEKSCA